MCFPFKTVTKISVKKHRLSHENYFFHGFQHQQISKINIFNCLNFLYGCQHLVFINFSETYIDLTIKSLNFPEKIFLYTSVVFSEEQKYSLLP